jgi:uncharacterized damage-inducible protein DinB
MDADLDRLLSRMREVRQETLRLLEDLEEDELLEPCNRFGNIRQVIELLVWHERDHYGQIRKNRRHTAAGTKSVNLLMSDLMAARGMVEGMLLGLASEDLDAVPSEGGWSIRQVVEHLIEGEVEFREQILDKRLNKSREG